MSRRAPRRPAARPRCSIVIPAFNQARLTGECLEIVLGKPPERAEQEVIVVDDGSTDGTADLLASYGERIRVVTHTENRGFAHSSNDGAAGAGSDYIVFLNNDTVPGEQWLDRLLRHAASNPRAAVVGAKLVYPDGRVQHAGVAISQDGYAHHLYAGFPGDHPAVNSTRRFQAVTAACMLVRRDAFEAAGGFDTGYVNGYEDVDLCLRLGELGHEVHYCHEAELVHLESMSVGRFSRTDENARRYYARWGDKVARDDVRYWSEDGLFRLDYWQSYPVRAQISPLLAAVESGEEHTREFDRVESIRARQLFSLLRRNIRLNLKAESRDADLESARADVVVLRKQHDQELAEIRREIGDLGAATKAALRDQLRGLEGLQGGLVELRAGLARLEQLRLDEPEAHEQTRLDFPHGAR